MVNNSGLLTRYVTIGAGPDETVSKSCLIQIYTAGYNLIDVGLFGLRQEEG